MLRIAASPLRKLHQHNTSWASRSVLYPAITRRSLSSLAPLRLSDEVQSALQSKKPLVALESTIISHGMPYPQNYETAIEVEKIVRDNGAIPATIAIIDGQIQIGLSQDQIRHLAKLGRGAVKASRRDLAVVMSKVRRKTCSKSDEMSSSSPLKSNLTLSHESLLDRNKRAPPRFLQRCFSRIAQGYQSLRREVLEASIEDMNTVCEFFVL